MNACCKSMMARVFLILICVISGACKMNSQSHKSIDNDSIYGCWISAPVGTVEEQARQSREVMVFSKDYYVRILQNGKGEMIPPTAKYKYTINRNGDEVSLVAETNPKMPPFKITYGDSDQLIMTQQWSQSIFIDKGKTIYKKASDKETDSVLKTWKISDMDISVLKIKDQY